LKFRWDFQTSTDFLAKMTEDEVHTLAESGVYHIGFGTESGSQEVLKLMNKTFQDFDSIYESAARCLGAGIRPSFNVMFAFPGEGSKERRETIDFMMDVCRRLPGAEFWTNIFTPYPGSPIMEKAEELGIRVPSSFEGWAEFFPRYTVLPWLSGADHKRLQVMREYFRIAFDRFPIGVDTRKRTTRIIQKALSLPARWRQPGRGLGELSLAPGRQPDRPRGFCVL